MRHRRSLVDEHEETREVWPAFTDVMSTMALILFVLVLLSYVRNLVAAKRLDALGLQITTSEAQLKTLDKELADGRAALQTSESKLRGQETIIADSNRQLTSLRGQLESIAVLRVDVLSKLRQAIVAELGPTNDAGVSLVTFGDNGNIVINESLVFESGSYAVKPEAKPVLDGMARALGNLLADASVRDNIDAIAIQGHTDDRGSASYNWELSAKRATAVVDYLFQANKTLADSYGRYFAASAYSKFRPLDATPTPAAYQENRRIEIAVIPRDGSVKTVIDDYMKNVPAAGAAP